MSNIADRRVMKKKHNLCCIAFARHRQQSLASEPEATDDREWQVHVKAYGSVKGGEERFCVRSVGRCRRSKTVRVQKHAFAIFSRFSDNGFFYTQLA